MKTFELKKVHLKLLKWMNIDYDEHTEFGAPEVDPKRPYGNSDVYQDMLEILGLKELKKGIYEFKLNGKRWLLKGEDKYNIYLEGPDEQDLCEDLLKLHKDTAMALQIVLSTSKFEPGIYSTEDYTSEWKLIKKSK